MSKKDDFRIDEEWDFMDASCPHICGCDCHRGLGKKHLIACCVWCNFCGKGITLLYVHQKMCHKK